MRLTSSIFLYDDAAEITVPQELASIGIESIFVSDEGAMYLDYEDRIAS